jgi:hypothetical protein
MDVLVEKKEGRRRASFSAKLMLMLILLLRLR